MPSTESVHAPRVYVLCALRPTVLRHQKYSLAVNTFKYSLSVGEGHKHTADSKFFIPLDNSSLPPPPPPNLFRETARSTNAHPVNRLIQAEVDLFMGNHDNIGKADLAQLERTVKEAVRNDGSGGGGQRHSTSRVTPRPHTAR